MRFGRVGVTQWSSSFVGATSSTSRYFSSVKVPVPFLAESISEADVGSIDLEVGAEVAADQMVLSLETEKADVEVYAPESGTIEKYNVEEGDVVEVGQTLFSIIPGDGPSGAPSAAAKEEAPKEATTKAAPPPPPPVTTTPTPSAPPKAVSTPAPAASSGARTETRVRMSKIRRVISSRLKDAQNTSAMLTTFQECDMSRLFELRATYQDQFVQAHGVKLGFMSAFVKASAQALLECPEVNAVIDGDEVIYRDYIDVSVAVASPKGLVVPVIRNADQLTFAGVEREIGSLASRARDRTLSIEDMTGGTFTISNGGVYGSLMGTPIINPPQSAILGMHGINKRPVVVNDEIVIRPMMYLALTYDHRLVDGKEAVTFLRKIKHGVEDPARLAIGV